LMVMSGGDFGERKRCGVEVEGSSLMTIPRCPARLRHLAQPPGDATRLFSQLFITNLSSSTSPSALGFRARQSSQSQGERWPFHGPGFQPHHTADHPSSCSTTQPTHENASTRRRVPSKMESRGISTAPKPLQVASSKRRHPNPCFTFRHDIPGRGSRKTTIHRPNPTSAIYTARRSWFHTPRATTTADDDC